MSFNVHELITQISNYLWPLIRISGFAIAVPVISSAVVPQRVRLGFVVFLTYVISMSMPHAPSLSLFSFTSVVDIMYEFFLGLMMGFIMQLVFQAFILGGQVVAMQTGLGFATLIDPSSRASVPLVAQLYLMLISLIFLILDGHLLLIEILSKSFTHYPIGQLRISPNAIWELLLFVGWVYKGAVLLALPAIMSLLTVNLSFGIMTKTAPQLNIFAVGFPITLTLGAVIIFLSLYGVVPHIKKLMDLGITLVKGIAL